MDEKILLDILRELKEIKTILSTKEKEKEQQAKNVIEKFVRYLSGKCEQTVNRTELRKLHYVNENKFCKFFNNHFEDIQIKLEKDFYMKIEQIANKGNLKEYKITQFIP